MLPDELPIMPRSQAPDEPRYRAVIEAADRVVRCASRFLATGEAGAQASGQADTTEALARLEEAIDRIDDLRNAIADYQIARNAT
jgi:hypothetical protein